MPSSTSHKPPRSRGTEDSGAGGGRDGGEGGGGGGGGDGGRLVKVAFARTEAEGELLARCDVLSLHLPLTPATTNLMDAARLARMKPGALLVNTGRGGLVDIPALIAALETGTPGAAALDVYPAEPQVPAELRERADVILTPHIAFASPDSVLELRRRATEDLLRVLAGQAAQHPVSPAGQ